MRASVVLLLAISPMLLGNAKQERAVMKRYTAAITAGETFPAEEFAQAPSGEATAFLSTLQGCKVGVIDSLRGGGWGVTWYCKQKPKTRAIVVHFEQGKIQRVLPSIVNSGY